MATPLRVLFVEDAQADVDLLVLELERGGYDVTHERVDTAHALRSALERSAWDLILSDYSMPSFHGPQALEIVKAQRLDVPFIIVSGTVDESIAVESMRAGACDFIAKRNLARLLPAIGRELRDASTRAKNARMAEQLLVSDRMASLGTLAAGVAHEINNPLAALLGNLEVVVADIREALTQYGTARTGSLPEVASAGERLAAAMCAAAPALEEACEASVRIREVTGDLKAFSWRERRATSPIDVRRILDSTLRLAQGEIRHRARVVKDYEHVPPVAATETRLGQIFLNLLINAAHAIPEGEASRHEIRLSTRAEGDTVVVEIHDTGPGIPDDVLPHIFDAFFTTKPRGVGTGLGLAITHRCVTELGGEIAVETAAARGTTFRITLPAACGIEAVVTRETPRSDAAPIRRNIVIVDDDALVLNAARRLLAAHHDVWTTTDPSRALERLLAGAECDVVLCDVLMPDFSGIAFFRRLEAAAPRLARRTLFMSGGAFTADARKFIDATGQPCIDKPFTAAALQAAIDELLAPREAAERPAAAGV